MARTLTIDEAVRGLNAFVGSMPSAMLEAVRRGLNPLRSAVEAGARRTRTGRALFGRKGLSPFLSAGVNRASGTSIQGFVDAHGYAALIEQGGRTKRHPIDPVRGQVLRFVAGGGVLFRPHVEHKGSQFKREEYMERAAEGGEEVMAKGIDQGLQTAADRLIG